MNQLTQKQRKVFEFVKNRLEVNSPPSQREIAEHFGIAQNSAYQLIRYLKQKGFLVDSGGHRGLRLSRAYVEMEEEKKGIPIVGRVAAGEPILAQENIEGYMDLGELFDVTKNCFILKVAGDSMIDEGIMDGDFVLVEPTERIENGRIGVVLLDGEATVKKVYLRKNGIVLKAANKTGRYKNKYIKKGGKSIRIVGEVTRCFRFI